LGFIANKVNIEDYQKLKDRCFDHSGNYWLKGDVEKACCKKFTIRLPIEKYKLRKSHKKILNRFKRFLCGDDHKLVKYEKDQNNSVNEKNFVIKKLSQEDKGENLEEEVKLGVDQDEDGWFTIEEDQKMDNELSFDKKLKLNEQTAIVNEMKENELDMVIAKLKHQIKKM